MERLLSLGVRPWFDSSLCFSAHSISDFAVCIRIAVIDDDVAQDAMRKWASYIHSRVGDGS